MISDNKKEKAELLEALIVKDEDSTLPNYYPQVSKIIFIVIHHLLLNWQLPPLQAYILLQRIHLLWGEEDKIFNLELAQKMKEYVHFYLLLGPVYGNEYNNILLILEKSFPKAVFGARIL